MVDLKEPFGSRFDIGRQKYELNVFYTLEKYE